MKVRTIALGLVLSYEDFKIETSSTNGVSAILIEKFKYAKIILDKTMVELETLDYIIQTQRIFLNSFEDWLLPLLENPYNLTIESIIKQLIHCLESTSIHFCTIGSCSLKKSIGILPQILSMSDRLSSSILFTKTSSDHIAPDQELCLLAANTCLEIAHNLGDLGNFRFCASFNCPPGIPFFPAAYQRRIDSSSNCMNLKCSYQDTISLSIGLESGDLLFLAFHGADNHSEGRDNLADIMRQALLPIQKCAESICKEFNIEYSGIDASINPGLSLPDSIGAGIESFLFNNVQSEESAYFGSMGTLALVSTITSAVKSLANSPSPLQQPILSNDQLSSSSSSTHSNVIKLTGYSGLMLPVMEDLILAQRAAEGRYSLRDLLIFSAVCGVGLDTVPIPGNTSIDGIACIYMEVAALAFRLDKPLSCRLLPMKDKIAGDLTEIQSPYLCNTMVFKVS